MSGSKLNFFEESTTHSIAKLQLTTTASIH
jgi:hypothetical protein